MKMSLALDVCRAEEGRVESRLGAEQVGSVKILTQTLVLAVIKDGRRAGGDNN